MNIDNEASDDFTIVEIFTEDRIGVLVHHHATACTGLDCRFTSRKFPPTWIKSLMSFMSPISRRQSHRAGAVETVRKFLRQNLAPQNEHKRKTC